MALVGYPELIANTRDENDSTQVKHLTDYYNKLGQWCDAAKEEAVASTRDVPELNEIATCLDYLAGMQWREQMPSYRAKPVSNEILSMFWETIGLLTDIKPMFHVTDLGRDSKFSRHQKLLNQLAKGWAKTSRFERSLAFCTMFGMLTSAPAKIWWNPYARGYSGDPMDGDISFDYIPPNSLLRLGINSNDLQEDECVIYRKVQTLEWIKRMFPRMGPLVRPEEARSKYTVDVQAPVTVMPQLFQQLSPGMKRLMGAADKNVIESVYPKAEVCEYWMKDSSRNESTKTVLMGPKESAWCYEVKPGKMLYPRGRLVIRANGVTLYDEPSPYYHRRFPFSILGLYAVPWQQYALSVISPWMKQQDIMNQIMAGVLQCVKKAVNPPLLAPKTAIHPEALRAIDSSKPNLKISYNSMATAPAWGNPPVVPPYVLQAYMMTQKSMRESSGAQAIGDALSKKQVPSGDSLEKIQFTKTTPVRVMGRNIEDFVNDIGGMWTADAIQFYDAGRRVQMLGMSGLVPEDVEDVPGSMIPDGFTGEDFVRRWHFFADKGSLLNVQHQEKIPIAFAMRKQRDISRDTLFDILDWNIDRKKNADELAEEGKTLMAAQAAAHAKGHK